MQLNRAVVIILFFILSILHWASYRSASSAIRALTAVNRRRLVIAYSSVAHGGIHLTACPIFRDQLIASGFVIEHKTSGKCGPRIGMLIFNNCVVILTFESKFEPRRS